MRKFSDFLKNKFVWGKRDLEHEEKKQTPEERASKYVWEPDHLEHHGVIKEDVLDEHFALKPMDKGNFHNPNKIRNTSYHHDHPHNKANEPEEGSDAHGEYLSHHENLSGDEDDAVRHYKGTGHEDINSHLRNAHKIFAKSRKAHLKKHDDPPGIKFKDEPEHHKNLKAGNKSHPRRDKHDDDDEPSDDDYKEHQRDDHIHHLDNVTNFRTPEHHTVYRGGLPKDKTHFPIGHEFTDHGYTSTSFRKDVAHSFANHHIKKKHVHVIHVPKGSRAHYFDVQGHEANHGNTEEHELVLHRGTKFKVTHHSEDDNTHYIHSRVVKQGIRHKFNLHSKQRKPKEQPPKDDHGLPGQNKFPFMKHHKRFK